MNAVTYPVHERFFSFQGEGVHAGRAAFFIRLFGCPLHCPWCDSAGTWHPTFVPSTVHRYAPELLAQEAIALRPAFVVLTGGEPTIHDLHPLCQALRMVEPLFNMDIHLETAGCFEFQWSDIDWITVSPKRNRLPLVENMVAAHEWKFVVDSPDSIEFWWEQFRWVHKGQPVYLNPQWELREDRKTLDAITTAVRKNPSVFRAGWQLHKLYRADSMDNRSALPAPLGGDPSRGY